MNWANSPAAENHPGHGDGSGSEGRATLTSPALASDSQPLAQRLDRPTAGKASEIRIDKCITLSASSAQMTNLEVFRLTLAGETIELLPSRNWNQLDHYKWTVRGKLPGEPAGLEVGFDHVKILGQSVALNDPAGCAKLEQLFNDWLLLERETLELARKRAHGLSQTPTRESAAEAEPQVLRFRVEVDKREQVHIHCVRGKETLASVGLTVTGFNSLYQQGLMRKPHALATGVLRDWVELDNELFSFEKGRNDAARLEQFLNEHYVPETALGTGRQVVAFLNAASSTGFDIQFPVMVGGRPDSHRHHLNERSLELLQDPDHCGLLHREIIVKLIPPNLVFKRKTPDGGEQYLPWQAENTVNVTDEEGQQHTLHLHQPLNLLRLSPAELTAIFNHPAINRHTKAAPAPGTATEPEPEPAAQSVSVQPPLQPTPQAPPPATPEPSLEGERPGSMVAESEPATPIPQSPPKPAGAERPRRRVELFKALANVWLKEVLAQPALPYDWFACLVYSRMAEWFGNSSEGKFGPCECWFISLGESEDIADPAFKGVFVTEKGSLGFLGEGQMARFYNRIAFIGTQSSALEGIQVDLVGVGLDGHGRVVFILSDNYRTQFDVRDTAVAEVLQRLNESGAVLMSVAEVPTSCEPLEVVWTVPADQPDPTTPQAFEHVRAVAGR